MAVVSAVEMAVAEWVFVAVGIVAPAVGMIAVAVVAGAVVTVGTAVRVSDPRQQRAGCRSCCH